MAILSLLLVMIYNVHIFGTMGMAFLNVLCAVFSCLGCMILYDQTANISISKIVLVMLVSVALTIVLVDVPEYDTVQSSLRMLISGVDLLPLPTICTSTLLQALQWINATFSTVQDTCPG